MRCKTVLKIIIVEDDESWMNRIGQFINKYLKFEELDAKLVLASSNPSEITNYVSRYPDDAYLFFVDIKLSHNLSGITLASNLRKKLVIANFVFMTCYDEYFIDVVRQKILPIDYIIKGLDFNKIEHLIRNNIIYCLSTAPIPVKDSVNDYFTFTRRNNFISIKYDDIYFFKINHNKKITVYAHNKTETFSGRLKEIENLDKNFLFRCHRGYIANIKNVQSFDIADGKIFFDSSKSIYCPVSVRKIVSLKRAWSYFKKNTRI